MCICVCIFMCIYMYVCICVCMYMCMCLCVCLYVYICIDWWWFHYCVRNSLVALLEALRARIFSFRFVNIGFCFWKINTYIYIYIYIYSFVCVCARSLTHSFFCLSQPGSCAWLSPFLFCADCTCVLVCLCLCMCMWKCVGKVIYI